MHEEFRQRLANEYRYAATKMQESPQPARKLFYFSVLFGEAQRVLNWQWDRDLALIHMVTQQAYMQVNGAMQTPAMGQLPIDWTTVYDKLTQVPSELAAYFEKTDNEGTTEELCQILGRLAEIIYVVGGNGSYLHEKGLIKL